MNILAIGAHPDDIELGCGATLLAHRDRGDQLALLVMTTGEQGPQAAKSRVVEQEDAAELLGAQLHWGGFEDGAIPEGRPAVDMIQAVARESAADVVYAPVPRDTHQDHRATGVASLAAARRMSRVLGYESPTSQEQGHEKEQMVRADENVMDAGRHEFADDSERTLSRTGEILEARPAGVSKEAA